MADSITYRSSLAAGKALTSLSLSSTQIGESMQRLSSGLRINSAKDDAAGLALSAQLNSTSGLYAQAVKNINQGISLVNHAAAAVEELSRILVRLQELSTQATNSALNSTQRSAYNTEAQALAEEYDRIASETEFNNIKLLDGSFNTRNLQADPNSKGQIAITMGEQLDDLTGTLTVGNGTFKGYTSYAGIDAGDVTLADLDGDSDLDVVASAYQGSTYQVLINDGTGTFSVGTTVFGVTGFTYDIESGDLNGDGKIDIVAATDIGNKIEVFLGNGNGTFKSAATYLTAHTLVDGVALADVNEDNNLDVIAKSSVAGYVQVFLGNGNMAGAGNGTLQAVTTFGSSLGGSSGVAAVDLNGDGYVDLVAASSQASISVLLGNGNNTYQAPISSVANFYAYITSADFNGDGKTDLVGGGQSGYVHVLLGNGNGTFLARISLASTSTTYGVEVGDLNGDGNQDIFAATVDGRVNVHLGNGNGTFQTRTSHPVGGNITHPYLDVGDLNGDGVIDIVATSYTVDKVSVLLSNTTQSATEIDLSNTTKAARSLSLVQTAITALRGEEAGLIGSQSRLSSAVNYLGRMRDAFDGAFHKIVDVDVAEEAANLVREQIIQQGSVAVLAQGNMQPEQALALLDGI